MKKKVLVTAITAFSSTVFGNIPSGKILEVDEGYAKHLCENKLAELVEEVTEEVKEEAKDDSSSTTSKATKSGTKRSRTSRASKS